MPAKQEPSQIGARNDEKPDNHGASQVGEAEMTGDQATGLVPPASPEEEAAIIRKIDWHLLPVFFTIYMLCVLDRSNLGNAHVVGLDKDIHLQGNEFALLGTIFYVGYIISQWTAAGWKYFPPHIWCAFVIFAWSCISSLQAVVSSFARLASLRFLLGVFEAMFAGLPLYLTFFYPRDRVGLRQGIFLSASALANAYGGALGYAIVMVKSVIPPWRVLFLIEGLPTLLMVAVVYFFIPDDLRSCRFLSKREKTVAMALVGRGQIADLDGCRDLRWKDVGAAFGDWRSYMPGLMYFSCNVSFASLPLFVPTIVSEIGGFNALEANGLSAPPYLFTFFLIIVTCFISDRMRMRGPFVSLFGFVSAIGFILLATTHGAAPRYLGIYLATTVFVCVSLLLPWTSNIHASESRRTGGWAIFATLGQCGPLVGTNIFPANEAPYYRNGSFISMAFCLTIGVLAAIFSLLLLRENRRLDKAVREGRQEQTSTGRPPGFRYII